MRKTITVKYLKSLGACKEAVDSFASQNEKHTVPLLRKYLALGCFNWVNWLLVRLMTRKQRIQYAVYAAELVLPVWEKKHPENTTPREAIEAAKNCIAYNTKKNKDAAATAARAAYAATHAAAYAAAHAARAAYAATHAAASAAAYAATRAAAYAAYAATHAASAAAYAATYAAYAAEEAIQTKIIEYGISLLS